MTKSGTTRLMAVVQADVVDYSGHVARDREGTADAVALWFNAFDNFAWGQGAEYTSHESGDSFLALFPSVLSAMNAAIMAQRQFQGMNEGDSTRQPIHVRMGVYMGDVYFRNEKPISDAINRAARLQGMAPPGGICMSSGVLDEVRSRMDFTPLDMGEKPLKGFDAPVRVYSISVYAPPGTSPVTSPAEPHTRAPYVPHIGKEPTDHDKLRFVQTAFQAVRSQFQQGVTALESNSPRINAEIEEIDNRRFVARGYIDGQEEAVVTIWMGTPFGSGNLGICLSEGDQGSGPSNSYSEILDVAMVERGTGAVCVISGFPIPR